jgi:hypothetical protein
VNNVEDLISRLLNESVDAELGTQRPAPPFQPVPVGRRGYQFRSSRIAVSLVAAACVAAVVGGAALVTQLTQSHHSPAAPTLAPTTRASTQPSAPGGRSAAVACTPTEVALTVTKGSTHSGDGLWLVLAYRNTASKPCVLTGYPTAEVVDAAGAKVESIPPWDGIGGQPNWSHAAAHITIAPGESASSLIEWSATAYQPGDSCSVNVDIRVALPGFTVTERLATNPALGFPIRMCGEAVTALVTGTTGTTDASSGNPGTGTPDPSGTATTNPSVVRFDGVGALRLGMTRTQVEALGLTGETLSDGCVQLVDNIRGPYVILDPRSDQVIKINLSDSPDYHTAAGIHLGSSVATVRATYAGHTIEDVNFGQGPNDGIIVQGDGGWLGFSVNSGTNEVTSIKVAQKKYATNAEIGCK